MRVLDIIIKSVELVKNIVEIVAIVVGGWWAYQLFILKDKPSLENTINAVSTIKIEDYNDSLCTVTTNLEIKNLAQSGLDIDSVFVRSWDVDVDSVREGPIFNIDGYIHRHMKFQDDKARTYSCDINFNSLEKHYSPDASNQMSHVLLLPKCSICCFITAYFIYPRQEKNKIINPIVRYSWIIKVVPEK